MKLSLLSTVALAISVAQYGAALPVPREGQADLSLRRSAGVASSLPADDMVAPTQDGHGKRDASVGAPPMDVSHIPSASEHFDDLFFPQTAPTHGLNFYGPRDAKADANTEDPTAVTHQGPQAVGAEHQLHGRSLLQRLVARIRTARPLENKYMNGMRCRLCADKHNSYKASQQTNCVFCDRWPSKKYVLKQDINGPKPMVPSGPAPQPRPKPAWLIRPLPHESPSPYRTTRSSSAPLPSSGNALPPSGPASIRITDKGKGKLVPQYGSSSREIVPADPGPSKPWMARRAAVVPEYGSLSREIVPADPDLSTERPTALPLENESKQTQVVGERGIAGGKFDGRPSLQRLEARISTADKYLYGLKHSSYTPSQQTKCIFCQHWPANKQNNKGPKPFPPPLPRPKPAYLFRPLSHESPAPYRTTPSTSAPVPNSGPSSNNRLPASGPGPIKDKGKGTIVSEIVPADPGPSKPWMARHARGDSLVHDRGEELLNASA